MPNTDVFYWNGADAREGSGVGSFLMSGHRDGSKGLFRAPMAKPRALWFCDFCTCFLSFAALWLAVGISIDRSDPLIVFDFWDENVLLSNKTYYHDAVNELELGVEQFCPNMTTPVVHQFTREFDSTRYKGTAIIQKAGSSGPWFPNFLPWITLMMILAISFIFQFGRLQLREYGSMTFNHDHINSYFILFPARIQEILQPRMEMLFDFKFNPFGSVVFRIIERVFGVSVMYDPYKPDFWRWVEYALTAPLQIILIANSTLIGERGIVFNLVAAQVGLVLLGYLNELFLDKVYKCLDCKKKNPLEKYTSAGLKLVISLVASWFIFVTMWWTIISRFDRQWQNGNDCDFADEMPSAVRFIVWGQAILFGLFGVVQTMQVVIGLVSVRRQMKNIYEYTPDQSGNLVICRHDQFYNSDYRRSNWYTVALLYSILSVLAKTLLEYGFIALVAFQENTKV